MTDASTDNGECQVQGTLERRFAQWLSRVNGVLRTLAGESGPNLSPVVHMAWMHARSEFLGLLCELAAGHERDAVQRERCAVTDPAECGHSDFSVHPIELSAWAEDPGIEHHRAAALTARQQYGRAKIDNGWDD